MMLSKQHFRAAALAVAFACAAPLAHAQTTSLPGEPRTVIVTMGEIIRRTLTNNVDILISRQNPIVDQFSLDGAYSAYDPVFGLDMTHSFNASPGAVGPNTGRSTGSFDNADTTYSPSLSGQLPFGLQYEFTGPLNHEAGSGIFPGPSYNGSAGVNISQPLLRNLWIDTPRYQIALARNLLKYDQIGLRLQIMSSVFNAKSAYYNLIYARQYVDVQQEALTLAQELVKENSQRVQLGAMAPLDEKQAESQAASSQADVLAAQQALAVQENSLKSLIALNLGEWNYVTPVPAEQLVAVPSNPDVLECWRTALNMRPDIQQAQVNLEKQKVTVKYDFNQLFPQLNFQGSYGHNGAGASPDADLGLIREGAAKFYSYGLVLSVPLENTGARASYKSSKATLQQLVLQFKKTENTVIVAVQNDVSAVQSDLRRIDATRQARIYAEDALSAEQTKLEHGNSTSFVVLQLQNSLTAARSAEIRALADYNIALEQLDFDEGMTLARNNIEVVTP